MTTQTHLAQLLGEPAKNATTGRPARNIAQKPTPESAKMKIFTSSTASTAISPWRKLVNMIIDIYIYVHRYMVQIYLTFLTWQKQEFI